MSLIDERTSLDKSSELCEELMDILVNDCARDLDSYINQIRTNFSNIAIVSDDTVDNIILNIPILIYYTNVKLEKLGLKDDLSSIERKKRLRDILATIDSKVIKNKSDRLQLAELDSIDSEILSDIYSRAYKLVKNNIDAAYEILASCKKIMSRRIEQLKVVNSDTGRLQQFN